VVTAIVPAGSAPVYWTLQAAWMGGDLVGFSLSWIAVPAAARGKLLDVLKLTPTGNFEEVPKAAASGINLPTGWYVVLRNRVEMTAGTSADLARLSRSIGVIACFVEEHVMVSWARGWSAGTLAWSVCHDLQVGLRHLEASGDLPPEYPAVRDRLLGKQDQDPDGADYVFDVPVALAERLTGFRHDFTPPSREDRRFEVLDSVRGGWRRWFA